MKDREETQNIHIRERKNNVTSKSDEDVKNLEKRQQMLLDSIRSIKV